MRLIDADALIADIRKNSSSYFADDFAREWVDKQPTVNPDGWIPVEERLPEEEQAVLICNKSGDIRIASGSYSTEINGWVWYLDGWRVGPVVAWRSLPPAFKPKEDK